jgi:hypothetical protein
VTSDERLAAEQIAEDAIGWLATGDDVDRVVRDDVILLHRPLSFAWFGVATRVRAADGDAADALIRESRAWFAERGRDRFTWMLGEHTTPRDMGDRLTAAGALEEPSLTALVLRHAPPPGPRDIEVRVVEDEAAFLTGERIAIEAFGFEGDDASDVAADARTAWAHWRRQPGRVNLLAFLDGQPIAEASMSATVHGPIVLSGGSTLPAARGRGAYRALVRWRWEEAVRRGTPTLIVQASPSARPILEGLGFRATGQVRLFADRSDR